MQVYKFSYNYNISFFLSLFFIMIFIIMGMAFFFSSDKKNIKTINNDYFCWYVFFRSLFIIHSSI